MDNLLKKIKVFVASPGDVAAEREHLPKIIQEINLIISVIAPEKRILLDLIRWETHVRPGLGRDAQDVVNQQISEYDIFIGIMWKRFGTPTSVAGSGTEEEYNIAYNKWKADNKFPVLFYFSQKSISIPNSLEELEQLKKVVQFKADISTKGLVWEYNDPEEFANAIRLHLIMTLSKLLQQDNEPNIQEGVSGNLTTESDLSIILDRISELKNEYERIRETMPAGNERTSRMAVVESKMRAMALQLMPFLPRLINSNSAGERLAAIATLKEIPKAEYLIWLAERVGKAESSFIGYNACLGLLNSARVLKNTNLADVKEAIERAFSNLNNSAYQDPNQIKILKEARKEIGS